MWHVASSHMRTRRIAMRLLIIKEDICLISPQEVSLVKTAKENRFIDTYIPCPQSADHPLVGGRRPGSHQSRSDRSLARGKRLLQAV